MIAVSDVNDSRLADYRLVSAPGELHARGLFVVEGRLLLPRLLRERRLRTRSILLTTAAWESLQDDIGASASDAPVYVVPQEAMNDLAGFNIHRGCLALVDRPAIPRLADVDLASCRRVIVLEGVNNPDNVGGVFRNAAAFDVDLVVFGPRCGDPFYRKAVRTSMGAALSVAIAETDAWPHDLARLRTHGFEVIALTPSPAATPLTAVAADLPRAALLLGAEGEGLTHDALAAADRHVRIEMSATVDSLNVATAAAIALHYFSRPASGG